MEDFCSYVGQAIDLFRYDPRSPMLFSSGLFLFVFLGFSLIYGLLKRRLTLRIVYVTLFSLYFYYKTSGLFFLLLVGLSLSDFAIGRLMHRSRRSGARKSLLVLSLLINLGLLCYFKYADLIVSAVAGLIDRTRTLPLLRPPASELRFRIHLRPHGRSGTLPSLPCGSDLQRS